MRIGGALLGVLVLGGLALQPTRLAAQEHTFLQSSAGPTIDDYVNQAGPDVKIVPHGALKIDGRMVNCGKRPTVLNSNFDSWGGAFPGFVILNTKKINGLSTAVKLYVYSHECGHQFVGPDETKADLFAIRRGGEMGLARRRGHGGHLRLHLDSEGRFGASARTGALRDHAQVLYEADRERHRPVGKRKPAIRLGAKGEHPRPAIAAASRGRRTLQAASQGSFTRHPDLRN